MSTPGGDTWSQQSLTFVATLSSELLTFLALGTPSGEPPVALLADVSLITQVPEPGTFALLAASLLGLVTASRLRGRQTH
jgi:hypothetical protein